MSLLFTPLTVRSVTFKNRIVMSPMCQYSSTDGFAGDWHIVHLGSRAIGGAGLVITEATAVSPEGRISPDDLGLWKDEHIENLSRITGFIHAHEGLTGIQLAHAGRKASVASPWKGGKQLGEEQGGWQTVAPSAVPYSETDRKPEALTTEGIRRIISCFSAAASRADSAGFDVLELHAAHGYLIHEFMSPVSNKRNDEYGGSFENRIRFLLETIDAVRKVWPVSKPLFTRISSTDWTDGGWTIDDSVRLAYILREKGVDLMDCSSGGNVHNARIMPSPGYQVPFSEAVRKTGILTGAVGLITTTKQAESILQEEKADLVFFARELLRNPYFPMYARRELTGEAVWPVQYLRAKN